MISIRLRVLLKQFLALLFILCAVSAGVSNVVKIEHKGAFSVQTSDNGGTFAIGFDTHDIDSDAKTVSPPAFPSKSLQSEIKFTASAIFTHTATRTHIRAPPLIS